MLRWVLRVGVGWCVCVCVLAFVWLCVFICLCMWDHVRAAFLLHALEDVCMWAHARRSSVHKRRNLIGRTTEADETWWTADSLSSCWWDFGGLSLRGGKFNFLPLLVGAVWITWPRTVEGVWHSILSYSGRISWESLISGKPWLNTQGMWHSGELSACHFSRFNFFCNF